MNSAHVELLVGLAAGLAVALLVWALLRSLRRGRLQRTRDFFGLAPDSESLLVIGKNGNTAGDMLALLELAGVVRQCGAQVGVVSHDEVRRGFGEKAEFCVGSTASNSRTAAHLEWKLPGVEVAPGGKTFRVGGETYGAEYVLLARVSAAGQTRPVFLVCGQTPVTNQAAVRYLVANESRLARKHGTRSGFCAVLKVINPDAYGPDVVEWVADVTSVAFRTPQPSKPARAKDTDTPPAAKKPAPPKPAPAKAAAAKPAGE